VPPDTFSNGRSFALVLKAAREGAPTIKPDTAEERLKSQSGFRDQKIHGPPKFRDYPAN
jgi:hypothetical protein